MRKYTDKIIPYAPAEEKDSSYVGGFVLTPVLGLHENVCVYDMKAMYPSIIMTLNLSPETLTVNNMDWIRVPNESAGDMTVGEVLQAKTEFH